MIKVGDVFKAENGRVVTVNAVCGVRVYYTNDLGLWFHKTISQFKSMYK
jgi:hypothetical protein